MWLYFEYINIYLPVAQRKWFAWRLVTELKNIKLDHNLLVSKDQCWIGWNSEGKTWSVRKIISEWLFLTWLVHTHALEWYWYFLERDDCVNSYWNYGLIFDCTICSNSEECISIIKFSCRLLPARNIMWRLSIGKHIFGSMILSAS